MPTAARPNASRPVCGSAEPLVVVAAVEEVPVAPEPLPVAPLVPAPEVLPPVVELALASTVTVPFMNGWIVQW